MRLSRRTKWQVARLRYFIAPAVLTVILLLWVRSLLPSEMFIFSRGGRLVLAFADSRYAPAFQAHQMAQGYSDVAGPYVESELIALRSSARSHLSLAGLEWIAVSAGGECRILGVSYLYFALAAGVLSAWSVAAMRRAAPRWLDGHCRSCGYDLRGNSEQCPECGTRTPSSESARLGREL